MPDRVKFGRILFYSLLVLFLLTIPFYDGTYSDELWDVPCHYGFNVFRDHGLEFGRDILFNYGPLGFLYKPLALPHHNALFYHYAFFALMNASFFFILIAYARRTRDYLNPAVIALLTFVFSYHRSMHEMIFGLVAILFYLEDLRRPKSFLFLFPAVTAALMVLVKFNQGAAL